MWGGYFVVIGERVYWLVVGWMLSVWCAIGFGGFDLFGAGWFGIRGSRLFVSGGLAESGETCLFRLVDLVMFKGSWLVSTKN